jgi:hypothetical protein
VIAISLFRRRRFEHPNPPSSPRLADPPRAAGTCNAPSRYARIDASETVDTWSRTDRRNAIAFLHRSSRWNFRVSGHVLRFVTMSAAWLLAFVSLAGCGPTTLPRGDANLSFRGPVLGAMSHSDWVLCHRGGMEGRITVVYFQTGGPVAAKPWEFELWFPIDNYHGPGTYYSSFVQDHAGSVYERGVAAVLTQYDGSSPSQKYGTLAATDSVRVTIAGRRVTVEAALSEDTARVRGDTHPSRTEAVSGTMTCQSLPTSGR